MPADIPMEILRLHHIDPKLFENATLYKAVGCPKCNRTGYKGRGAMMEILLCNDEMRDLVLKEPSSSIIATPACCARMKASPASRRSCW